MTAEPATPVPPEPRASTSGLPARASVGTTAARPIPPQRHHPESNPSGKRLAVLGLTALGIVYGDIGTSPLYALRECFKPEYGLAATIPNVYGILSLIVWSLIVVVSIKYIVFIMRADNRGEGGILALLALILQRQHREEDWKRRAMLISLGIFGAALLYGDGVITPAITVLSAMEGLDVATPAFRHLVVPISVVILVVLFSFQKKGTHLVGSMFGPVMALWFLTLGIFGTVEIAREPQILKAVNPWYALRFAFTHGTGGFLVLGAVVLAVTGAEALYADMGHFGKKPIRLAWFAVVLPALLLNYFGQGALILREPAAAVNPFFLIAPRILLWPLVLLATMAAIIASQALISGAFSLTQQTIQLGYSPRMTIVHTSAHEAGQIYVPEVNKALMVGCIVMVLGFESSTALGAAYGIAVTGTMAITTLLFYQVARHRWGWSRLHAGGIGAFFLLVDLAFLSANVIKIEHGGWVPLAMAIALFTLMTTWHRGRAILREILRRGTLPLDLFLEDVERRKPVRVGGTAVFMTSDPEGAPVVLLHHLKHNKVLHDQVILLSILSAEVPEIEDGERVIVEKLHAGFYRVQATYGFMETPDVKAILARCEKAGIRARPNETTYYLGRERLIPYGKSQMATWRKKIFAFLSRNARSATEFFGIPPNRVVELGTQIEF